MRQGQWDRDPALSRHLLGNALYHFHSYKKMKRIYCKAARKLKIESVWGSCEQIILLLWKKGWSDFGKQESAIRGVTVPSICFISCNFSKAGRVGKKCSANDHSK